MNNIAPAVNRAPQPLLPSPKWKPIVDAIRDPLGRMHFHHTHWFADFHSENDCHFPYEPGPNKAKIIRVDQHLPGALRQLPAKNAIMKLEKGKPEYVAMVPFYFPFNSSGPAALQNLLTVIRDQAFDQKPVNNEGDKEPDIRRLHVVVLINRPVTLSQEETDAFVKEVEAVKGIKGLDIHLMAGYWTTQWKASYLIPDRYDMSAMETRRFVRIVDPSSIPRFDLQIREACSKVVPHLSLRQLILKSPFVDSYIERSTVDNPLYGVTWDSDTISLNHGGRGYLSLLDGHIKKLSPDLISLGYNLPDTCPPLAHLAARADMATRVETNAAGLGVYSPEPSTAFVLNANQTYRFATTGQTVEGRRFVQAGLKSGALRKEHIHFIHESALVTSPDRIVPKSIKKINALTKALFVKKALFQALRGLAQTHLDPHQWAENVYVGLPKTKAKRMTDITAPLMEIFKSCDLVNRVYAQLDLDPTIEGVRKALLSQQRLNLIKLQKNQAAEKEKLSEEERGILEGQNLIYSKAMEKLKSFGVETETIKKCLYASARSANRAIPLILEAFPE